MNDKPITILDEDQTPMGQEPGTNTAPEGDQNSAETDSGDAETVRETPELYGTSELEQLWAENSELREQVKRTAAEFQNFRRRQEEEQKRVKVRLREEIIRSLLPILDHLERTMTVARQSQETAFESLLQGLELIDKDVKKIFGDHGLASIDALGETFDPAMHEAIMMEETDEHEDQTILQELQRGYRLDDRVLRPSLVKVARNNL